MSARGAQSVTRPLPNYKVIVLRVQFQGTSFSTNQATTFFQRVQDYYVENSYGAFTPTFTISPIFSLTGTEATYGANCPGDVGCRAPRLISESISSATPSIDFTLYDQVMIYHAGFGEEANGRSDEIWSLFFPSSEMAHYGFGPISADGKSFDGAMVVPELERGASALGVICHEYGHQLGLPDLYDTSMPGGRSTAGAWDLMDYPWTGSPVGDNPPHLGAWSKRFLEFGSTEVMTSTGAVSLTPMAFSPGKSVEIYRSGLEYFLVEYRLASAGTYDRFIPQEGGFAVWHVDEDLLNRMFESNRVNVPSLNGHNGVDLVESDRGEVYPPGDDDLWTDGFTLSSPASDLFSGAVSSLVMTAIQGTGGPTMTAHVLFRAAKNQQSVARAISYPNPADGNVRAGAPPGTFSTLRLQLSRPVAPTALTASLYTILGQRVLSIPGSQFVYQVNLSRDYEWIFEYDWDGRDETGAEVASGVYYLNFDVDGEKIRKSLVVQR
jgi:M6 family metalloprotease-like protein